MLAILAGPRAARGATFGAEENSRFDSDVMIEPTDAVLVPGRTA
jgi:hypothetical protein